MFNLKEISKSFGKNKALNNVNLELKPTQITVLLGANGCGKSTLLRICAGLARADSGEIVFGSKDKQVDEYSQIGHSGHKFFLYSHLNVEENINLAINLRGLKLNCAEYLESWNLGDILKIKFSELSEGKKRRVALARAFVHQPSFVFLDEPTSSLDQNATDNLVSKMQQCAAQGACILIATHDIHRLKNAAKRIIVMERGTIVGDSLKSSIDQALESYARLNR